MTDFQTARINMVDCQLRTADVTDHAILAAMQEVPREVFVPETIQPLSYIDEDIALGAGADGQKRYLMEPAQFARLLQLAEISASDVVLDIGCATGYSSAVLSKICSFVVAIEQDSGLAAKATSILAEIEADNVVVMEQEHSVGLPKEAPYDAIFVNGAVDSAPMHLVNQLKDGGRLVFVEGIGNGAWAKVCVKRGDSHSCLNRFNAAVRTIPGFSAQPEFQF